MPADIRQLAARDWQAILEIDRRRYGDDSWSKYFVRMAPVLFGRLSCIAELDGAPIGYCLVAPEDDRRVWILALVVKDEMEGQGIGQGLLAWALDAAARTGFREARLTVTPDNERALRLYVRFGFHEVDRDPAFFGPNEPRILLSCDLTMASP